MNKPNLVALFVLITVQSHGGKKREEVFLSATSTRLLRGLLRGSVLCAFVFITSPNTN